MPEPEVFNWIPREGMETTRKPSVITVKFGDGYEQRRAGGLNADLKTFKPAGIRAFLWRPPKHNRTVRVVCREWSISDNAMYTDFNCTFEEVTH